MSTPTKQEIKDKTQQQRDADELQDRIINLRDQERQVQREAVERREQETLEAAQRLREQGDRERQQQRDAYGVIDGLARSGIRQLEDGTRHIARGTALSVTALIPPILREPTLLVDLSFNAAISVLSSQRDFLIDLLTMGRPVSTVR